MGLGKSTLYSILPPGTRYRELWLPELINNHATLPSSIARGHPQTLTGARKGTTADGVHFTGAAGSNINCGAIHNAATKLWISFRFKLDQPFGAGDPEQRIMAKHLTGNDQIFVLLDSPTGRLGLRKYVGGPEVFLLLFPQVGFNAGQWYHVLASISDFNAVRLIVDGGTPVTDADVTPAPNGGNFIIGSLILGFATGLEGVVSDVVVGTADLSTDEEADLYKGIPPANAVNFWPLDEGRGVTVYDRGSGVNNGTLDTSATWAWGQVKQPILSLDGINDLGQSSAGVDISGDLTMVWVGKMKSTYSGLIDYKNLIRISVDDNNIITLGYIYTSDVFRYLANGGGVTQNVTYSFVPIIDDYVILIGTLTLAGVINFIINGSSVGTASGVGAVSGAAATAWVGATNVLSQYDISKPLLVGVIDGAFTEKEARTFSKKLNDILGLGLTI